MSTSIWLDRFWITIFLFSPFNEKNINEILQEITGNSYNYQLHHGKLWPLLRLRLRSCIIDFKLIKGFEVKECMSCTDWEQIFRIITNTWKILRQIHKLATAFSASAVSSSIERQYSSMCFLPSGEHVFGRFRLWLWKFVNIFDTNIRNRIKSVKYFSIAKFNAKWKSISLLQLIYPFHFNGTALLAQDFKWTD